MFVKNFKSIKRETINVNDEVKRFLTQNGYFPVSKNNNEWVYISNDKVLALIEKFKGGDNGIEK